MRIGISKGLRKICMVVLLCILFGLLTSSCEQKAKFEKGFGDTFTLYPIMFGAKSNTDSFDKDNVSMDIYYGVHNIEQDDPKSEYTLSNFEESKIFFGLYICDVDYISDIVSSMEISDYKSIDNYYFIKEISEEEAFTEDYAYEVHWNGVRYNHSERITIPRDFFTDETGSFAIMAIAFYDLSANSGNYFIICRGQIKFVYQTIDDNTIKIMF